MEPWTIRYLQEVINVILHAIISLFLSIKACVRLSSRAANLKGWRRLEEDDFCKTYLLLSTMRSRKIMQDMSMAVIDQESLCTSSYLGWSQTWESLKSNGYSSSRHNHWACSHGLLIECTELSKSRERHRERERERERACERVKGSQPDKSLGLGFLIRVLFTIKFRNFL